MASSNTTAPVDFVSENGTTRISDYRCGIICEAAGEIEELSRMLRGATKNAEEAFPVRGITVRMEQLSNIIMSAMSDNNDTTEELAFKLRRERDEAIA